MLLNNFSYYRSVIHNQRYKNKKEYNNLVPTTQINDSQINVYTKKQNGGG